ncbi:hypothetical protein BTVI_60920 [Pitangus sulphuratus]|nr:hypothetical protein BTVI_60920 [Pitangus sulphuratus]
MYTNARSMGNKQEDLEALVQQESYDVVAITETWWDDSHDQSAAMDGYKLFRKDRQEVNMLQVDTPGACFALPHSTGYCKWKRNWGQKGQNMTWYMIKVYKIMKAAEEGAQNWTPDLRRGLTSAQYNGTTTFLVLLATLLLIQDQIPRFVLDIPDSKEEG